MDDTVNGAEGEVITTETPITESSITGIAKNVNGVIDYSASSVYATYVYPVTGVEKVRVKTTAYDSDSYYRSAYYVYFSDDELSVTGQYLSSYSEVTEVNTLLDVPSGSTKCYVVSRKKISSSDSEEYAYTNDLYSVTETSSSATTGLVENVTNLLASVEAINTTIATIEDEQEDTITLNLSTGYFVNTATVGTTWTNLLVADDGSSYTASAVTLDDKYIGNTLKITVTSYGTSSGRYFGFCDENNVVVASYTEKGAAWVQNGDNTYTVSVPIVTPYFFFSIRTSSGLQNVKATYRIIDNRSYAYVAPDGSDDDDGLSLISAFATVNKALRSGKDRILLAGGSYYQQIDLGLAIGKHVCIESVERASRPVFYDPDCVLATSATLSDGVYSATITQTIASGNIWLYQDGVGDATTEIDDDERHPLQRGKTYRCDDTKIVKCSASSLADALTEITGASDYRWYLDGTTLYFSAPSAPSESNPICASLGNDLFLNADRSISLTVNGIESKYLAMCVKNLCDVTLTDCCAMNVFGYGAITYDNTLNAKFVRCEAGRCVNSTNGDGINGDVTNTGEAFAKHYSTTLIDCWCHDNADDGYSSHRHAESTIIGGLFEFNGKSGVTPSYGEHCTCYNAYSRHNYSGFMCAGDVQAAEGGKYGQMWCVGCLSEENTSGGDTTGYIVRGEGNRMTLIGCKAIGERFSYTCGSTAYMRLVDCSTLNQTYRFNGTTANITVQATSIITST